MTFRFEPTGMGIRIMLPGCGYTASSAQEMVSWMIRPAAGPQPRLKEGTALKDVLGRALVKRARSTDAGVGRAQWRARQPDLSGSPPEYVLELRAPNDIYDRVAELAREGKPPGLVLDLEGAGKVWDPQVDPQITVKGWRANLQVTPDDDRQAALTRSPAEAQLAAIQRSLASARVAAWAAAVVLLMVLLHLR